MGVTILTGASRGGLSFVNYPSRFVSHFTNNWTLGIGAVIADILLNNKSTNIIAVARSEEPLRNLKIKYGEDRVATVVGDLSDVKVSKEIIDTAIKQYGKIDSIIANAGVLDPVAQIKDAKVEEWRRLFDVNFFSIVSLVSLALPHLRESKGNIVLVSSGASTKSYVSELVPIDFQV